MILIDNTVLSNFALVGELILLEDYCQGKGATTDYVLAEFEMGVKDGIFIGSSCLSVGKVMSLKQYNTL